MTLERNLKDWMEAYMKYTEDTEPASIFHRWVGMSVLAGALRKKTCLSLGRIRVYPNLYIVLVAEPGIARKSQSITFGQGIMTQVPELIMSADVVTREALLQDIEACAVDEQLKDGTNFKHSSLSVISREFESFLGQKKENTKMLVMLTDLFDAQEIPYKYRVKNSTSNEVPSVFLNLLAATTPESLASCLPSTAIGGGLTSRVLFVWADRKQKKCAIPKKTQAIVELEKKLVDDLYAISRIVGEYQFSPEAEKKWDDWYNDYDETSINRICRDPAFNGWYSRKPTYILKVAIICAAAKSNSLVVEWSHLKESIDLIESLEFDMGVVFKAIGKSTVTSEVDTVIQLVRQHKAISEKVLLSLVWRDMDAQKFDNVISTAIRSGKIQRQYKSPKNIPGEVWYYDSEFMREVEERIKKKKLQQEQAKALESNLMGITETSKITSSEGEPDENDNAA